MGIAHATDPTTAASIVEAACYAPNMEATWVASRNPFAHPHEPREVVDGITLLGTQRVNFHAVTDGRAVTLVDCGFQGHRRYLHHWLARTRRTLADIDAVVLTHRHADHVGFAADFAARGVPVWLPAADLVAGTLGSRVPPPRMRRILHRPRTLALLAEAALDGVFWQPHPHDVRPYTDGDVLDVPGKLRVVQVPGHTAGNSTLHHTATDSMLTGDALMTLDPMKGTTGPLVFAEHPRDDQRALDNLRLLQPYGSARVLPGHGTPLLDDGALGRAIAAARIS